MADFFLRLQGSTINELPNAPSSLVASEIANREFVLSWTNNTEIGDNNLIQKWNESTLKWETLSTVALDATEKKVTGLQPNSTFRVRVAVYIIAQDAYFPSQILDVQTTNTAEPLPSNVEISEIDYESALVTWENNPIAGMGIQHAVKVYTGTTLVATHLVALEATEFELTGLTQATTYGVVVCVKDEISEVEYEYCAALETFTTDNLDFGDLTATVGMNAIQLDWSSYLTEEDTEYKVYVAISETETFDTPIEIGLTDEQYLFTGLSVTTLYNYKTIVADAITDAEIYSETGSATTLSADDVKASSMTKISEVVFPEENREVVITWENNNTVDDYNLYMLIELYVDGSYVQEYYELPYSATSFTLTEFSGTTMLPFTNYGAYLIAGYVADYDQSLWNDGIVAAAGSYTALRATSPVFVSKTYSGITYTWTNNDIYVPDFGSDDYQKVAFTRQGATWAYNGLLDFDATGYTFTGLSENTAYSVYILLFETGADYTNRTLQKTSTTLGSQTTEINEQPYDAPTGATYTWAFEDTADSDPSGIEIAVAGDFGLGYDTGLVGECLTSGVTYSTSESLLSLFSGTTAFSISGWYYYPDGYSVNAQAFVLANTNVRLELNGGDSRLIYRDRSDIGNEYNSLPVAGAWSNVVLTYDGQYSKVYHNGTLLDTVDEATSISPSSVSFGSADTTFGDPPFVTGLFHIDQLRVYPRALVQEEVTALYNHGNGN